MYIQLETSDSDLPEWVFVELQGELVFRQGSHVQGLDIGKLEEDNGNFSLTIGNNRLKGKLKALPKPMIVTRRAKADAVTDGEASSATLQIAAIVRRKLVFNSRPFPIIERAYKKQKG